jgi:hypothetical protein
MNTDSAMTKAPMPMAGLSLLLVPSLALAHGQQIVFVPLGQITALIPVAFIAWRLTRGWFARTAVIVCAVLVPTVILFMPIGYIPWWLVASERSSFLTGLLFSVLVACALSGLYRALAPRAHGT